MSFSIYQILGVICVVFVFIGSCVYLVGWVNVNSAVMEIIRNLWAKMPWSQGTDGVKHTFPNTLEGFGYYFNQKGELLNRKDNSRFQFAVREGDHNYNQQHYVALGEPVTEHVYKLMETDLKLQRVPVPVDARQGEPQSFIFKSKDASTSDKLMVLIHGSGAVRAGQWSRKLIINENVDTGSQLPYIRRAIAEGFGVIVMNPNLNEATVNKKVVPIRGSETPEKHGVYVWKVLVEPAKAKSITVVAHSYGGIVACTIAQDFVKDWKSRVFSVVFTDSVHMDRTTLWSKPVKEFMKQRAVNFVSSDDPLNSLQEPYHPDGCSELSAGTPEHERTSHSCIESAFQFIRTNLAAWESNSKLSPLAFLRQPPQKHLRSEL